MSPRTSWQPRREPEDAMPPPACARPGRAPATGRAILMVAALVPALLGGLLAGCQQDSPRGSRAQGSRPRDDGTRVVRPTEDPRLRPYLDRFQRVEVLITRWDALRADGRTQAADALAVRLRDEVDPAFDDFARASRGELGPHAQYLAASALGFSARPEATRLLVERLRDRDARLLGNSLIALSVRADPSTPLEPIAALLSDRQAQAPRRYAPLVIGKVLEARAKAGMPADPGFEQMILAQLGPIVVDNDPIVRLHVARALGALRVPGTYDYLQVLVGDPQMRIRWAAAAGLEKQGDPRGFPEVVRLLHEVAPESKHVIRDVLVSYAARLQGRPLTREELDALGTGARAWSQWYTQFMRSRGMRTAPER